MEAPSGKWYEVEVRKGRDEFRLHIDDDGKILRTDMTISPKNRFLPRLTGTAGSLRRLSSGGFCAEAVCAREVIWFAEREGFEPPETSRFNGFQDRRNRPLCIFPATKVAPYFHFTKFRPDFARALPACGGRRTAFLNGRLRPRFRPAACPLSVFLPCVARAVAVSLCRRGKRSKRMFGKFLLTLSDTVRISRRRML